MSREKGNIILFSEILTQLRKEAGLSQVDIAHACNISNRQYQRFEYGEQKPGLDKLIALADYFNVSLDYLVGRSSKREVTDPLPGPVETE